MGRENKKQSVYVGAPLLALCGAESIEQLRDKINSDEVNFSGRVNACAARYVEICRRHKPALTDPEWLGIMAAIWSTDTTDFDPRNLANQVQDAVALEMIEQTIEGLDGNALVAKLQAMDYACLCAVLAEAEKRKIPSVTPR